MEKEVAIIIQAKKACPTIGILIEIEAQEIETMNLCQEAPLEITTAEVTIGTMIITDRVLRPQETIISEITMVEVTEVIEEVTEVLLVEAKDHLEAIGGQEGDSEVLIGGEAAAGSGAIVVPNLEKIIGEVDEAATEVIAAPEVVLEDLTGTGNN